MPRKFDPEPVCCGVCQREAVGLGYAPRQGKSVLWLCKNDDCLYLGRVIYKMAPDKLTFHEAIALSDAGEAAGAYLESIGKFDMSTMSTEEWTNFTRTLLITYGEKMRERLLSNEAPF